MSKRALILTWEKFQDHEVIYPYYALQEHGFDVTVAANERGRVFGILGAHINCDILVEDLYRPAKSFVEHIADVMHGIEVDNELVNTIDDFDLLVIPGGVKALEKLRLETRAVLFATHWMKAGKPTMCICNGAQLLITADALRGRKCSGYYAIEPDIKNAGAEYDRGVVVDGNLVSCAHYDDMGEWMRESMTMFDNATVIDVPV